jgi:hypothetical protein
MDKLIIQIISIISKSVNSLAIHCQVVTQCAKHQLNNEVLEFWLYLTLSIYLVSCQHYFSRPGS